MNGTELPMADSYSVLKFLVSLSFVLGLIFLCTYVFKKIYGVKTPRLRQKQIPINIVGNVSLGDKKFLSVVEIQKKHYFLGISQTSVNLLSELDLEIEQPQEEEAPESFTEMFNKAKMLLSKVRK